MVSGEAFVPGFSFTTTLSNDALEFLCCDGEHQRHGASTLFLLSSQVVGVEHRQLEKLITFGNLRPHLFRMELRVDALYARTQTDSKFTETPNAHLNQLSAVVLCNVNERLSGSL